MNSHGDVTESIQQVRPRCLIQLVKRVLDLAAVLAMQFSGMEVSTSIVLW